MKESEDGEGTMRQPHALPQCNICQQEFIKTTSGN